MAGLPNNPGGVVKLILRNLNFSLKFGVCRLPAPAQRLPGWQVWLYVECGRWPCCHPSLGRKLWHGVCREVGECGWVWPKIMEWGHNSGPALAMSGEEHCLQLLVGNARTQARGIWGGSTWAHVLCDWPRLQLHFWHWVPKAGGAGGWVARGGLCCKEGERPWQWANTCPPPFWTTLFHNMLSPGACGQ